MIISVVEFLSLCATVSTIVIVVTFFFVEVCCVVVASSQACTYEMRVSAFLSRL